MFEPDSRLEFEPVAKGETSSTILSLLNQSAFPVTIEDLTLQEEGLGDTSEVRLALPWSPRTLKPAEQVLVNVIWQPTDDEIDYGTLTALTSLPIPGRVTVGFSTPDIVVIDSTVVIQSQTSSIELTGSPHRESGTQTVVVSLEEGSAPFVFSGASLTHKPPLSQRLQEQVKLLGLPAKGERFEADDSFSFSLEFSPKDYLIKQGEVMIRGESSVLRIPFKLTPKRPPLHQSFEHGAVFACALDQDQKVTCWGGGQAFSSLNCPQGGPIPYHHHWLPSRLCARCVGRANVLGAKSRRREQATARVTLKTGGGGV